MPLFKSSTSMQMRSSFIHSPPDPEHAWHLSTAMGEEGLEPSHLSVPDPKSGASTKFRHPPARWLYSMNESGGNRTHNLWIKSPLLCQLSYAPIIGRAASACNEPPLGCQRKQTRRWQPVWRCQTATKLP